MPRPLDADGSGDASPIIIRAVVAPLRTDPDPPSRSRSNARDNTYVPTRASRHAHARRRAHHHTHEIQSSVVRASSNARVTHPRIIIISIRPSVSVHPIARRYTRRRRKKTVVVVVTASSSRRRRIASHLSFVGSFARMNMRRPRRKGRKIPREISVGRRIARTVGDFSCLGVPFPDAGAKNVDIFVSTDSSWSPSHRIHHPHALRAFFVCVMGGGALARSWMDGVCVCVRMGFRLGVWVGGRLCMGFSS